VWEGLVALRPLLRLHNYENRSNLELKKVQKNQEERGSLGGVGGGGGGGGGGKVESEVGRGWGNVTNMFKEKKGKRWAIFFWESSKGQDLIIPNVFKSSHCQIRED